MNQFIYAAEDPDGNIKIGISFNPRERCKNIGYAVGCRLKLLGAVAGEYRHERELHTLLRPWATGSEWYRNEGAVAAFLAMLPKVGEADA